MDINELKEILNRDNVTASEFYVYRHNRAASRLLKVIGEVPEFDMPYSPKITERIELTRAWESNLYPVAVEDLCTAEEDTGYIHFAYLVYIPETWDIPSSLLGE